MASHTIAGETFRSTDAFARALRAQADGIGPWTDRNDTTGIDGLELAIDDAGPWLSVVADVVRQWIDDDDVALRSMGVAVAWRVAGAIGASFLVERLTRHRARFDGVAPVGVPTNQPDLRWSLLMALDRAVTVDDTDAIALLRDALQEPRGFWVLNGLGRVDVDWLLAHAAVVIPKRALGAGLAAMPDTARRIALVRAMAPWSDEERRAAIASPLWSMRDDAEPIRDALLHA